MKKALFILMLLMAINLTAPSGNAMYQRQRHLIEFTQEFNRRSTSISDGIAKKTVMYFKYAVLLNRVLLVDYSSTRYYNTS